MPRKIDLLWIILLLNIITICSVLGGSLYVQFVLREFPCPLCVEQRIMMFLCASGNIYIITRTLQSLSISWRDIISGCAFTLFAAVGGSAISIRQILLHIVPPDPGYGTPILGLHIYSWALIIFVCEIFVTAILLLITSSIHHILHHWQRTIIKCVTILFICILTAHAIVSFIEQDFTFRLPDNPTENQI